MSTTEFILTPNYEHMFAMMLREAKMHAEARTLFDCLGTVKKTAEALRAVQRFLAPLNIACQSMTNREAVERFRDALNQIVQDIDTVAGEREEFVSVSAAQKPACRHAGSTWEEERNGAVDQD